MNNSPSILELCTKIQDHNNAYTIGSAISIPSQFVARFFVSQTPISNDRPHPSVGIEQQGEPREMICV